MIEGKKINLREIEYSDLAKMVEWRNKDEIRRWFFDQHLLTMEKQRKWYKNYLENDKDKMFIIETKEGIPVGTVGLKDIDWENRRAEFGRMMIAEDEFQGKGLAKDAVTALINYAFNKVGLKMIYLEVFADNKSAIRLYEKCGFKESKIIKKIIYNDSEKYQNVIVMKILNEKTIEE